MPGATLTGVVGQIKWQYYMAAAINGYTVSRNASNVWSLRGTVVSSDPFKMNQRPLTFVAPHKEGAWRWPIESFQLEQGVLTATLGQPLP
jgi:hypothetical protein